MTVEREYGDLMFSTSTHAILSSTSHRALQRREGEMSSRNSCRNTGWYSLDIEGSIFNAIHGSSVLPAIVIIEHPGTSRLTTDGRVSMAPLRWEGSREGLLI